MKILQINTTANRGSTGRITEWLGHTFLDAGHDSCIVYGRHEARSRSELMRVGGPLDLVGHGLVSAALSRHGFGSLRATRQACRSIKAWNPDVVLLHNLHGYYIHIEFLFDFLSSLECPILWTLYDCWAFTGHCTYFDDVGCTRWQTRCHNCPKLHKYPYSFGWDRTTRNFEDKRLIFNMPICMELLVHSDWLAGLVRKSYLNKYPLHVSPSGVDLSIFHPGASTRSPMWPGKKIILGVASRWDARKGLDDLLALAKRFPPDHLVIIVGWSKGSRKDMPSNVMPISRTDSIHELAAYYARADVFVNPTYQDNFPTVNLEALACGTPVVTYRTGGSPEAIDDKTGVVVDKGDLDGLLRAVQSVLAHPRAAWRASCRRRAERLYNKEDRYADYLRIVERMVQT
jgi:putative colanic acid biosynthesis glycosyltransferase